MNKLSKFFVITFLLVGCSYNIPSHKIMDRDKYTHDYNKEITILNTKQILYCKNHYRLETVKMINTKHGVIYIVKSK
jgi:flavorubredoxin|tara:strand:- start:13521 stop:13751 length:231 start_codon:yes stop_codon:yes gene_type:complete